jgi:tetratricopeptide (TPR) repeat protein
MTGRRVSDTWTESLPVRDPGGAVASTEAPRAPLSPFPDHLGPYLPEEMVGRGGMAAVYRCRDARGEPVAVKWLHQPIPSVTSRFALEIRALSRLDHPGVVRYLGHGEHQGRPYLVMEYLEGEDLRLWAHRLRALPPQERHARVRHLAIRLAEALAYIHGSGLVHRDVKPSNIRVIQADMPVLTDFGVVKDLSDQGDTMAGVVIGTLHYASPEQIRGDPVDARTDLYGLGCTLYTVLLDRRPFEGSNRVIVMKAQLEAPPVPPSVHDPTVPADLEQVILRLMAKRPQDRPQSADELIRMLSAVAAGDAVTLAGRKTALDRVAHVLERVAGGLATVVWVSGPPGSGRGWILDTLGSGAARQGLRYVVPQDRPALEAALARVAAGEVLLVATEIQVDDPDVRILVQPLGVADVRRSVVGANHQVDDPAVLAERLFRATGGLPALLVPLLERIKVDRHALDGPLPGIDAERWLGGLDLDTLEVLQVLATIHEPASMTTIEEIAQVPAEEALLELTARGLVRRVGPGDESTSGRGRFVVSAGLFADVALAGVPNPEGLRRRVESALGRGGSAEALATAVHDPWQERFTRAIADRDEGRWSEAGEKLRVLVAEAERQGNPVLLARAVAGLGTVDWAMGHSATAEAAFRRALDLAPNDLLAVGNAWNALGILEVQAGRPAPALDFFARAATAFQQGRFPSREVASWLNLAEARSMAGQLAGSLDAADRAVALAQGLAQAPLECASLRHKGLVLLDVGLAEESGRTLADATALAHAARLAGERFAAHVLRAQASLDAQPGTRMAAAAATDRLLRVLGEADETDPEGHRPLAQALLARAAAILGDGRTFHRASHQALASGSDRISPVWIRILLQVARARWTAGQRSEALENLNEARVHAETQGFLLLAWEAALLLAQLGNRPLPPPGDLATGLSPKARAALARKPAFP